MDVPQSAAAAAGWQQRRPTLAERQEQPDQPQPAALLPWPAALGSNDQQAQPKHQGTSSKAPLARCASLVCRESRFGLDLVFDSPDAGVMAPAAAAESPAGDQQQPPAAATPSAGGAAVTGAAGLSGMHTVAATPPHRQQMGAGGGGQATVAGHKAAAAGSTTPPANHQLHESPLVLLSPSLLLSPHYVQSSASTAAAATPASWLGSLASPAQLRGMLSPLLAGGEKHGAGRGEQSGAAWSALDDLYSRLQTQDLVPYHQESWPAVPAGSAATPQLPTGPSSAPMLLPALSPAAPRAPAGTGTLSATSLPWSAFVPLPQLPPAQVMPAAQPAAPLMLVPVYGGIGGQDGGLQCNAWQQGVLEAPQAFTMVPVSGSTQLLLSIPQHSQLPCPMQAQQQPHTTHASLPQQRQGQQQQQKQPLLQPEGPGCQPRPRAAVRQPVGERAPPEKQSVQVQQQQERKQGLQAQEHEACKQSAGRMNGADEGSGSKPKLQPITKTKRTNKKETELQREGTKEPTGRGASVKRQFPRSTPPAPQPPPKRQRSAAVAAAAGSQRGSHVGQPALPPAAAGGAGSLRKRPRKPVKAEASGSAQPAAPAAGSPAAAATGVPRAEPAVPAAPAAGAGVGAGPRSALQLRTAGTAVEAVEPAYVTFQLPTTSHGGEAGTCAVRCRFLFQKRLSASDASKLGRIVVPRCAEAYLPPANGAGGIDLQAQDTRGRRYTLRYKCWITGDPPKRTFLLEQCRKLQQDWQMQAKAILAFYRMPSGALLVNPFPLQSHFADE